MDNDGEMCKCTECPQLREKNEILTKRISSMIDTFDESEKDHQELLQSFAKEIEGYKQKCDDKDETINILQQTVNELKRNAPPDEQDGKNTNEEQLTHLIEKIQRYEQECDDKDETISRLQQTINELKLNAPPDRQETHLQQLNLSKETIYVRWKEVVTQRDYIQQRYEALQEKLRAKSNSAALNETPSEIFPSDYTIKLTSNFPSDYIVTLTSTDDEGRFGVTFNIKQRRDISNQVNVYIRDIDEKVSKQGVSAGDFVLAINDVYVENCRDMSKIKEIVLSNKQQMKLELRPRVMETNQIIEGHRETYHDWGISLGIFIKEIHTNSYGYKNFKLKRFDEIVGQVNGRHDVCDLSLNSIMKKFNKAIKFNVLRRERAILSTSSDSTRTGSTSSNNHDQVQSKYRQKKDLIFSSPSGSTTSGSAVPSLSQVSSDNKQYITMKVQPVGPSQEEPGQQTDEEKFPRSLSRHSSSSVNSISDGKIIPNETFDVIDLTLTKDSFARFGWQLIGGNNIGIYVNEIDRWSCAGLAGIQVGWKLLEIEHFDLREVGYSFAIEAIQHIKENESVRVKFQKVSEKCFKKQIQQLPYDSFYVKAIENYTKANEKEMSFKKDDILCITDSCVVIHDSDDKPVTMWRASKDIGFKIIDGLVPSQRSSYMKQENTYELIPSREADPKKPSKKLSANVKKRNGCSAYYKLTTDSDVKAINHDMTL